MQTKPMITIRVAEGALPLLDGESIDAFREALVGAIREDYIARGIVGVRDDGTRVGYCWLCEVFDDFAVMEVDETAAGCTRYEKVPFTRAPDGTFTIGAPVVVRRKVEWEPVGEREEEDESTEHYDRERDLRTEITTEIVRGHRFPVGDPDGVKDAILALGTARFANVMVGESMITSAERAQLQSIVDRTNRRAGSNIDLYRAIRGL